MKHVPQHHNTSAKNTMCTRLYNNSGADKRREEKTDGQTKSTDGADSISKTYGNNLCLIMSHEQNSHVFQSTAKKGMYKSVKSQFSMKHKSLGDLCRKYRMFHEITNQKWKVAIPFRGNCTFLGRKIAGVHNPNRKGTFHRVSSKQIVPDPHEAITPTKILIFFLKYHISSSSEYGQHAEWSLRVFRDISAIIPNSHRFIARSVLAAQNQVRRSSIEMLCGPQQNCDSKWVDASWPGNLVTESRSSDTNSFRFFFLCFSAAAQLE